jgi:signal transduction histidine kinase
MRLGIRGKQVLGVTSIVVTVVVSLSVWRLADLARVRLEESNARADLLAKTIFHRARVVVAEAADPYMALRTDPGLRAILESALYSNNVTFAAIADVRGVAVAHNDSSLEGQVIPTGHSLGDIIARPALSQLVAVYRGQGQNFELTQPFFLGNTEFGSIRIGVSTLLIRSDFTTWFGSAVVAAVAAAGVAAIVATLLAQLLLRPIHVLSGGLKRLGRGEFGVRLDLDQSDEFGELGSFFNVVSAQLSADRAKIAGQVANLESAVGHLEDAVAMVGPNRQLLFANPAMRLLLPGATAGALLDDLVPAGNPLRQLAEQTLLERRSLGPVSGTFADRRAREGGAVEDGVKEVAREESRTPPASKERLVITHAVNDPKGDLLGVMIIARNVEYLGQVESTIRYSRKLAALGRLSAGVAHEVKNPLHAMMIHLELLRQQFLPKAVASGVGGGRGAGALAVAAASPSIDDSEALQHVEVIAGEIRRLDEVVQGFLKFTRPEDLKLQPVRLAALFDEVLPIVRPEAQRAGVTVAFTGRDAPDVNGDPAMLRQAFLNLALNACQAMPQGGTLDIRCEGSRGRRVIVSFADTGIGIKPEHLSRVFDLYFTTKPKGSGIGLSMVFRTVQMHDGEIEVQSTPGAGTTFRLFLPQA